MSRLSTNFKSGGYREVLFWLLLLGSWQFLASPGSKNGVIGAIGTAVFLLFASANLDQLTRLGLDHARWRSVRGRSWLFAIASGFIAGASIFWVSSVAGEGMRLSNDKKLILLQVTLGPVLEEVVFRGYLFAALMWVSSRVAGCHRRDLWVVAFAALLFAVVHLAQPGVSWLQIACITSTGILYGLIRHFSGSVAPSAVAHASYNITLYALVGFTAGITKIRIG